MASANPTVADFEYEASTIIAGARSHTTFICRFCAHFGTTLQICKKLWKMLDPCNQIHKKAKLKHLLWALVFMKIYGTETVLSSLVGVSEKIFRKWVWLFIEAISYLKSEVVSYLLFCNFLFYF